MKYLKTSHPATPRQRIFFFLFGLFFMFGGLIMLITGKTCSGINCRSSLMGHITGLLVLTVGLFILIRSNKAELIPRMKFGKAELGGMDFKPYQLISQGGLKKIVFDASLGRIKYILLAPTLIFLPLVLIYFRNMFIIVFIIFVLLLFLFLFFWFSSFDSVIIKNPYRKTFVVDKSKGFYRRETFTIKKNEMPYLRGKRSIVDFSLGSTMLHLTPNMYRVYLNYNRNGKEKGIDVRSRLIYKLKPRRLLSKEQISEIAKFLGLRFVVDKG